MATVTAVVCDLCGKPAHQQITIDVCEKHEEQAKARMNGSGSFQSIDRYHSTVKAACPYCGAPFFPQGMAQHVKGKHPGKLREWRTNRDAQRDKERRSKLATGPTLPKAVPCEICGRLTSPLGMFQHVSKKHPEKFKAWRRKHPAPK